jgi:Nod factor-specific ABC transporter NodJ protein
LNLKGIWAVVYRDILREKKRGIRSLVGMALSPLLFFIAFGWGLGRNINISGVSYMFFILSGLIAMNGMNTAFSTATTINVERFYWKTFEEFQVAPISSTDISIGKIMFGLFKGLAGSALIYLLGMAFGIFLELNFLFIVSVIINCFMFSSMALLIAFVVKTHQQQGDFNSFIMIPMAFLSGTFFPIDRFPHAFKAISLILPLTHSTNCIRAAILGNSFPYYSFMVVIGYTILFLIFGIKSVRDLSL